MRNIQQIVIHHSTTDPNNKDIWAESIPSRDYHAGYYIDGREYAGNYHVLIYQDGEVKYPVDYDWYTFHAGNYDINLTSIAVSFVGNFEENEPSEISLVTCKRVLEELQQQFNISNIYLHRDLFQTACPGKYINIEKIMEAQTMLNFEQVRKGYLSIMRREPDGGQKNVYVGSNISLEQFYCELGDSVEHTDYINDALKYRSGQSGSAKYEEVKDKLYRKL